MSTRTNAGSVMDTLSLMAVGKTIYIETTKKDYAKDMRAHNPPKSRRPAYMREWVFTTQLFTAVPACATAGGIRYLVAVERVK